MTLQKYKHNAKLNKGTIYIPPTNLTFRIPISLQPDDVNLRYFNLKLFDLMHACNIKGLRHRVKIQNLQNAKSFLLSGASESESESLLTTASGIK